MMKKVFSLFVLLPFLLVLGLPGSSLSAVAIGFDYSKVPGDPNFADFVLPPGIGDNLFDLYLFNGTDYYFKAQVTGGSGYYSFDPGGVDRFRILGIEASAGVDPSDPEAFSIDILWVDYGNHIANVRPISGSAFSDIPVGYWAEEAIMAIFNAGITGGCTDSPLNYCPQGIVTREQMAVFITRVLGQVAPAGYCGTTNPYTDVAFDRPTCSYIKKFSELGITSGYGDGRFGPGDPVTREQMAVFLSTALNMVPSAGYCRVTDPYTDVDRAWWSCSFVKRFSEMGITGGYGDGRFGAGDPVTREQMAVFLARTLIVKERQNECSTSGLCYAEGGELSVTGGGDPAGCLDGLRILIPPGALDVFGRSFWIVDDPGYGPFGSYLLPAGFIGYPRQVDPCDLALESGGNESDVDLEFYFPVQGMTVGPGEIACAIAYDEQVGKWRIVLPDSIDDTTMTVKAKYRMVWKWGKIVIDQVRREDLIPLVEEKYGTDSWQAILDRINQFYNEPEIQALQPTCASLITLRDNFLESMVQSFRQRLETFQTQFGDCVTYRSSGLYGTCEVLSEEFFSEALVYFKDKMEIGMIQLLQGGGPLAPLLSGNVGLADCLLLWRMFYLYEEINSLGCAYECVTEKGGLNFWIDFAVYYASKMGQAMITLAINEEWIDCSP